MDFSKGLKLYASGGCRSKAGRGPRVHRIQLIDELPGAEGAVRGWLSMERFCAAFIANISWAFPGWLI
jgi:hypothetical protein